MAGRPKTTAKKLAEIEEAAFRLSESLANMRPPVNIEQQNAEGSPGWWWCEACQRADEAAMALSELLSMVEKKAGLPELQHERETRRGLLPLASEGAEEAGCVGELKSA